MSSNSDMARLEYALKLIADIELILDRHKGIDDALDDREGHHALMMCCMQIGETPQKIQSDKFKEFLPVTLAYGLRNVIAHDYLGISHARIKSTIEVSIPALKRSNQELLES